MITRFLSLPLLCILLFGCKASLSTEEQGELAHVYAELLITENQFPGDKAKSQVIVDSLLQSFGYTKREEVIEKIESLAESDPEGMKYVLDSVRRRVDGVRSGAIP